MTNNMNFSTLLSEWYSLNARLILDESLSEKYRYQLMHDRKVYSNLFNVMETQANDKHN